MDGGIGEEGRLGVGICFRDCGVCRGGSGDNARATARDRRLRCDERPALFRGVLARLFDVFGLFGEVAVGDGLCAVGDEGADCVVRRDMGACFRVRRGGVVGVKQRLFDCGFHCFGGRC